MATGGQKVKTALREEEQRDLQRDSRVSESTELCEGRMVRTWQRGVPGTPVSKLKSPFWWEQPHTEGESRDQGQEEQTGRDQLLQLMGLHPP